MQFLLIFIQTANPGPGTYGELKSSETASSSFSKKGFGGFASKVSIKLFDVRVWEGNLKRDCNPSVVFKEGEGSGRGGGWVVNGTGYM